MTFLEAKKVYKEWKFLREYGITILSWKDYYRVVEYFNKQRYIELPQSRLDILEYI